MRYTKNNFPAKNEDGLVALLVVGIMIILLSLTTVAFTKLMGRESQQALDRELSTQAYYAAVSGINDAKDYLNTHPGATLATDNCDTLANNNYPPFLGPNNTDDIDKITCVVGDTAPQQLFYQIDQGQSRIFEISSTNNIGSVLFSWDNAAASGYNALNYKPVNATAFDTDSGWNGTGPAVAPALELTYYPIPDGATDLPTLSTDSRTIFLYPAHKNGAGAATYTTTGQLDGSIVNNACQASSDMSAVFTGATSVYHCNTIVSPNAFQTKNVFVKVSAFYSTAYLAVRANDATNSAIAIKNAQVVLDATGKGGSDVLKRLQTIVNYRPNDAEPSDVIETAIGLCKRLEYNLTAGSPQLDSSVQALPDDTNQACHTSDLN